MSAKEMDINKSANQRDMNLFVFRKANGFTAESFDSCSQSQMLSLDFFCILFARYQFIRRNLFLIGIILVRINCSNGKWFEQGKKFLQILMFSGTKRIGQRRIGSMFHRPP